MKDINECLENSSICGESECENSYGTYTCIEPTTTTTIQPPSTTTSAYVTSSTTADPRDTETDESDVETNETPEEEVDEGSQENESEIGKVEDIDDSHETQHEKIDINNEVVEVETSSPPASTNPASTSSETTTEMSNEIPGQVESEKESDEDSNGDEQHSDVDEEQEEAHHHQSSTVKSDVGAECDDGSRLDSHGKCVGEYY